MPQMSFPYKKVLVIGATSGIGKALATKLVLNGTSVIISGRRKESLENFIQEHGAGKVQAKTIDITQLDRIAQFATDVIAENPDLDCIFVNSGIQRPFDFSKPDAVDLDILDKELATNYTAPVCIAKAFIPHLQGRQTQTALAFTTSQLAIIPMLRCPNYGASKAALHHFIITLRTQLQGGPGNVKVVEIFPPAVQTELHDTKHQSDLKNGHLIGMPLQDFIDDMWDQLSEGQDEVVVGSAKEIFEAIEPRRYEIYQEMTQMLNSLVKQFLR